MFRISRLSDDQDFRAYSTGDARWFQRLHEKDIKGSYTDSRIEKTKRAVVVERKRMNHVC